MNTAGTIVGFIIGCVLLVIAFAVIVYLNTRFWNAVGSRKHGGLNRDARKILRDNRRRR